MRRLAAVIIKYTNLPIIVIPRYKLAQIHQKRKSILKTDSQSYFGRFDDFHIPDRQQAQPGEKVTADLIHFTPLVRGIICGRLEQTAGERIKAISAARPTEDVWRRYVPLFAQYYPLFITRLVRTHRERERDFVLIRAIVLAIRWDTTIYRGKSRDVNIPVAAEGRNTESWNAARWVEGDRKFQERSAATNRVDSSSSRNR